MTELKFLSQKTKPLKHRLMINSLQESWDDSQVKQLHSDIVSQFLKCEDAISVQASVEYAKFLCQQGLNKENYPFVMSLFLHENEEFIQALLSDGSIYKSLLELHKNQHLIFLSFELLDGFTPGTVLEKTLETILKVIAVNYNSPFAGYRTYPLSSENLYSSVKFLETNKPQNSNINRLILDILGDLGELNSKDVADRQMMTIGSQANQIRNAFLDNSLVLETVMPFAMLGGKQQ